MEGSAIYSHKLISQDLNGFAAAIDETFLSNLVDKLGFVGGKKNWTIFAFNLQFCTLSEQMSVNNVYDMRAASTLTVSLPSSLKM